MNLQPLTRIHLYSPYEYDFASGDITYVTICSLVAFFILLISCINFMNLTTARSANRAREIGTRRILGATVSHIVFLLSEDFTKWVIAANLVAWPVFYYAKRRWLQGFAYRITLPWWVFGLSTPLALAMALLTVSYQSVRSAVSNPVDALKYE